MKKIMLYIISFAWIGLLFCACSEDDLSSKSVIIDPINQPNEFDLWLDEHYRAAYNIQFKYKYEDIESNLTYNLVPANLSQSIILAKMVKFLWLEPYSEIAGVAFMRTYAPRIFHVIGTVGWNSNGTFTLGTAEGGLKITLYAGNWLERWFDIEYDPNDPEVYTVELDKDMINDFYLHTIHHEFAHILHQTKDYPAAFKLISAGSYVATWNDLNETEAAKKGFISPYASSEPNEDFVETLAFYLTLSDAEWQAILTLAGNPGASAITLKLNYVKSYMKDTWGIDMDRLKNILARRYDEIYDVNWVGF